MQKSTHLYSIIFVPKTFGSSSEQADLYPVWVPSEGEFMGGLLLLNIVKENKITLKTSYFHRAAMSVCFSFFLMSPFHVIFFEVSHWPSGHMIRFRPSQRCLLRWHQYSENEKKCTSLR